MPDLEKPDFAAVNEEREKRAIQAIIDFDWGDYRLHEMEALAEEIKEDIAEDGESNRIDWARDLARDVLAAGRPLNLSEINAEENS